jgi:hypothetical protein
METHETHHILFMQLVYMLHAAAMHQLGKVKNPITGKVERDLPAAQSTIDMLDMLAVRTKGNLVQEEEKLLTAVLMELRLNYVDEAAKPDPQREPAGGQPS